MKKKENIGRTLFDINHSKIFFDPPPRVMEIKKINKQMGPNETSKLSTAKETINKVKRQPSEWEKIFATHVHTYLIVLHSTLLCLADMEFFTN